MSTWEGNGLNASSTVCLTSVNKATLHSNGMTGPVTWKWPSDLEGDLPSYSSEQLCTSLKGMKKLVLKSSM